MPELKFRPPKENRRTPHAKPACGAAGSSSSVRRLGQVLVVADRLGRRSLHGQTRERSLAALGMTNSARVAGFDSNRPAGRPTKKGTLQRNTQQRTESRD